MAGGDALACLLALGDETHPFALSPQVPARPLKVTWPRRVDLNGVSVFRSRGLSRPRSDDALRRLDRRKASFRKLSAGVFLASEGDMAADNPSCIVLATPLDVPGRTRSGEDHIHAWHYIDVLCCAIVFV